MHARLGALAGEEAFLELAIWRHGEFVFTPGEEAERVTIERSNTNLLMEAARRVDEWKVLTKRIASTHLVPCFAPQSGSAPVSLAAAEWALVRAIDERRSLEEIALALGQPVFEVAKTLYGLLGSGLVTLREP